MKAEKNLKWFFGPEGGEEIGPNDPIHEKYKGNPYYSIVREAIQNSMDAVNDNSKPVKVEFSFFSLRRTADEFPNLFKIEEHIESCKRFYSSNKQALLICDEMLRYLNGNNKIGKRADIQCMRIADYNTIGMFYNPTDKSAHFYAFLKSAGVSAKTTAGSGGSFGFGKGAYFVLSPIKTIIVSTLTKENKHFFEGRCRLMTHKNNESDKPLTAAGYYDNGNGKPIENLDEIPDIFRRKKTGTDVNIIGLQEDSRRKTAMIKSVLNNFWLAIYRNELEVKIDDIEIAKNNLEEIIEEYFEEQYEKCSSVDYENWNPKPYFNAVKYANQNDHFPVFREDLSTIGEVRLYVYREKKLPNRIAYHRRPKMVVHKKTNGRLQGYVAVFLCENEAGNELLKEMENPAHNQWKKENYIIDGKPRPNAVKAERELSKFINNCLENLSSSNLENKQSVFELEEYLNIPEDLMNENEEYDGENTNESFGKESNELSEEETGLELTELNQPVIIKPTYKPKSEVKDEFDADFDEEGEEKINAGNGDGGGDIVPPEPNPEGQVTTGKLGDTPTKRILPISYRVVAQKSNGNMRHLLIINSSKTVTNSEIEFFVGTDNNSKTQDNTLSVIATDNGSCSTNKLQNTSLLKGTTKINIQFDDNSKHSVKIKAYEIQ